MTKWQDINISIDLIQNTINQLEFLESIDKLKLVLNGDIIYKAIYRYSKWLPFYKKHRDAVYPPLDVMWIWHCHMLEPSEYYHDSMAIAGELLNHTNLKQSEILQKQEQTKLLWESELDISYDYLETKSVDENYNHNSRYRNFSNFTCDLHEASKKQIEFYYQVALPHYKCQIYLKIALERYKKFLYLKKTNPSVFLSPCFSIELIWHTHQLNPVSYLVDTTSIFGVLLDHEDSVVDRKPGKQVDFAIKQTICLWKQNFDEEFFFAGSLYRGKRPSEEDYTSSQIPFEPFATHVNSFDLKELSLRTVSCHAHKAYYEINLYQLKNSIKIPLLTNHLIENEVFVRDINHVRLMSELSPTIILDVRYHEADVKSKIKNVLKHGHRHDSTLDRSFQFELKIPQKINVDEEEEVKFYLENHKNEEYALVLKWNVCANQRKINLEIDKEEFHSVNMNEIKHEYLNFELNEIEFKNANALRGCHRVLVTCSSHKIPVYDLEILHIISMKWTSIRLLQNGSLLSSSKLLDLKSLPSLRLPVGEGISLNLNTEKAMLVSNINGDYALVKGKWIGYGRKNPGKLLVNCYFFASKTSSVFAIHRDFIFEFRNEYISARIDLKTGEIQFNIGLDWIDQTEIESFLAVVFSITTIHVLLQPKVSVSDFRLASTNTLPLLSDKLAPVPIDTTHFLLNTIGYNELISSPGFREFFSQDYKQTDNEFCFENIKHSSWLSQLDLNKSTESLSETERSKSLQRISSSNSRESLNEDSSKPNWDEYAYNAIDESEYSYHKITPAKSYYSAKSYDISDEFD